MTIRIDADALKGAQAVGTKLVPTSLPPRAETLQFGTPWSGDAGTGYALRNPRTPQELDASYLRRFATTRSALNKRFLEKISRLGRVLEVGCSRGTQLDALRAEGFDRLYGVDVSYGGTMGATLPVAVADGFALPFPNETFEIVFTSGTLMHVHPHDRERFCTELLRVSKRWVWGFEITADPELVVEFGGVVPKAWALMEPKSFEALGCTVHRVEHFPMSDSPWGHSMYLVEKP